MAEPILDIKNLTVVFRTDAGRTEAIRDLSLSIEQGEILAVVGESGCGKSVLCKTIMGLLPQPAEITSGSIRISSGAPESPSRAAASVIAGQSQTRNSEQELTCLSDREYCRIRGADIAMVFQDPMTSLDPSCSIGSQIAEAIHVHDRSLSGNHSRREIRSRVIELMEAVGIDRAEQRYDAYPWMLSGGMRQRCVLAMALALDCRLLIADEPTTALDVTVQAEILDLLLRLRDERNLSVLFISHDLGVVSQIADTVAIMYAGRIIEIGTTSEVLKHPAHPYTWGLLHALPAYAHDGKLRPIPGSPPTVPEGFAADAFAERNTWALGIDYVQAPPYFDISPTHRAATWLADPRAPKVVFERETVAAQECASASAANDHAGPDSAGNDQAAPDSAVNDQASPLLQLRNVSHTFRLGKRAQVKAAEDVSFDIASGELFALVGESGSGKTTLARCILGWYQPVSGRILYDGIDITGRSGRNSSITREDRLRLSREIQFISQDPGAALDPRMTVRELIAEPLRIHGIYPGRREREDFIRSMLREVQLDDRVLDRIPAQLSGGQKQRVSIARAYSMNPRLLVADEPLASLDVSIQAQIVELLLSLQQRHGTSILFISHDLAMVELIADRVGVMYRGHLVETAPTAELFHKPRHPYTKTLLASIPMLERISHTFVFAAEE